MRPKKALRGDPHRCENCIHFEQHYIRHMDNSYAPCYCGHCKYPRLKSVSPGMVCGDFSKAKEHSPLRI